MIRFKEFLVEYLTDKQKKGFLSYANRRFNIGETPSKNALELSKNIIPEGKDTIRIPVMNRLMQEVHDHITSNGFSGMDYGRQIAYKQVTLRDGSTKQTEVKLGKALNATGASKELIGKFANDDHQKSAELSNKHQIIISRNPLHIAEKSTNKTWSSCARLDYSGKPAMVGQHCGSGHAYAAEKLPSDIYHGTHVAYLVDKDDSNEKTDQQLIDNATARISIKPFHSYTEEGVHSILRPESKVYFSGYNAGVNFSDGFRDTIKNFTDKHSPLKDNVIYKKERDLYDDDGKNTAIKLNITKPMPTWSWLNHNEKRNLVTTASPSAQEITDVLTSAKNNPEKFNKNHFDMISYLHKSDNYNKDIHGEHILHPNIFNNLPTDRKKDIISNEINDTFDPVERYYKPIKPERFNKLFDLVHNNIKQNPEEVSTIEPFLSHSEFSNIHMNQIYNSDLSPESKQHIERKAYNSYGNYANPAFIGNTLDHKIKNGDYSNIKRVLDTGYTLPDHINKMIDSGYIKKMPSWGIDHIASLYHFGQTIHDKMLHPSHLNDCKPLTRDAIISHLTGYNKIGFINNIAKHKEQYKGDITSQLLDSHSYDFETLDKLTEPHIFNKLSDESKNGIHQRIKEYEYNIDLPHLHSIKTALTRIKSKIND